MIKGNLKKLSVLLALALIFGITGCSNQYLPDDIVLSSPVSGYNQEVAIADAFCIDSGASFPFQFTLKNLVSQDIEVSYIWTLNDPKADFPGSQEGINNPSARIYQGQGVASLSASGSKEMKINIGRVREYDPRFYVMYIYVYRDGELVGYYSGQKSPFDWDYGTIPPVPKAVD